MAGPRLTETIAAQLVGGHYGTSPLHRDDGSAEGVHDFDVVIPSGKTVALEVTTSIDGALAAMWSAVEGQKWEMPELERSWTVLVAHPVDRRQAVAGQPQCGRPKWWPDMKRLAAALAPDLAILESHGVEKYHYGSVYSNEPLEARKAIARLGRSGTSMAVSAVVPGHSPCITIAAQAAVTATDAAFNAEIERHIESNATKLGRADADERHLFVWLAWNAGGAQYGMMRRREPSIPPRLPASVSAVWVAPAPIEDHEPTNVLWLWRATAWGWETIRTRRPGT